MTSTIEPPGAGTDFEPAGAPGRGLAAAVIASTSAIGMLVASLVLARIHSGLWLTVVSGSGWARPIRCGEPVGHRCS